MRLPKINPFEWLYIAISIATFTHTSWGASMSFEGLPPTGDDWLVHAQWAVAGYLIAIAIDVGMFMSARFVAKTRSWSMAIAFLVAAVSSFYMQVLYIYHHSPAITNGAGVSPYWKESLVGLIDARVILLPLLLPVLAVVYTLSRMAAEDAEAMTTHEAEVEEAADKLAITKEDMLLLGDGSIDWDELKFFDSEVDRWYGPYKNEKTMRMALKSRATRKRNKKEIVVRRDDP